LNLSELLGGNGVGLEHRPLAERGKAPRNEISTSLSKVPVTLQVILGTAQMPLSELLALKAGSEVKLDFKPGDPVTILINGCKVARGDLYVLEAEGDRFGVKISELLANALPI
jgi:flagellar motor switch protein FliN